MANDYIVKEILLMYPNFDTAELVANKAIEWLEQHYERIISSAAPANLSIIKDGFESGTGIMNIELEQKRKEIVASVEDLVEDFDNVISESRLTYKYFKNLFNSNLHVQLVKVF